VGIPVTIWTVWLVLQLKSISLFAAQTDFTDPGELMNRDQASKDGMWTLRRSGMERMKEGITALEEVVSSTVEEE